MNHRSYNVPSVAGSLTVASIGDAPVDMYGTRLKQKRSALLANINGIKHGALHVEKPPFIKAGIKRKKKLMRLKDLRIRYCWHVKKELRRG